MSRFGFVPVGSALHDWDSLRALVGGWTHVLERIGGREIGIEEAGRPEPMVVLVLTGGTERELLELWSRRRHAQPHEPLLLLAHAGHNSLPAALEALARVQQRGAGGRIFYVGSPEDALGLGRLREGLNDLGVRRRLTELRVGLLGAPSDWLVASSPEPAVVQAEWGVQITSLSLASVHEQIDLVPAAEVAARVEELRAGASFVREPDAAALEKAARVYLALRGVVQAEKLDALSVRCFDLVTQLRTTGCYALAQLNDDGIIAGCEGDIAALVTMLWSHLLLEQVPWMANPSRVDETRGRLWLAHCTVPRKLVRGYGLRSHFESGLGVALEGKLEPGPATLVRIGGPRLDRMWVADAAVLMDGHAKDLCRTQIEVSLDAAAVGELLRAPLGNHLVLVRGHHAARLRSWWQTQRG